MKQKCDNCEKKTRYCNNCNSRFDDGESIICEKKVGNHFCDMDCLEEFYQIEETNLSDMNDE